MNDFKKTVRYLYQVAGKYKIAIIVLAVVHMLLSAIAVVYALMLRNIVDNALAKDTAAFWQSVILFALLMLSKVGLTLAMRHLSEYTRSRLANGCRLRLFGEILRRDYAGVTARHSGDWMSRMTSDVSNVASGVADMLPELLGVSVKLVGAVSVIVALEPRFLWVVIPAGLLLLLLTYQYRQKMKQLHKNVQETESSMRSFLQETLGSLLVVRAYIGDKVSLRNADQKTELFHKAVMKRRGFSNLCNIGFSGLMNGAYVVGAAFCGYGILQGTLSYGTFTAMLQLIGQVQAPFANLSGFLPRWYGIVTSVERLTEIEQLTEELSSPYSDADLQQLYDRQLISLGLEDASFAYNDIADNMAHTKTETVLEHVHLRIGKGSCVALTGGSGSGKSTIMKILLSLYRLDSGRCYLQTDGETVDLDETYRGLFAYVPQGNHLMSGTIQDAVTGFCDGDTLDEALLQRSLKIACADFVEELPDGLNARLGERGVGLSEGQLQRLAIARAIYSNRPILLLDEATSALDEATERRLLANLQAMTNKTVLIITHRPAALEICDQIIALSEKACSDVGK